MDQKVRKVEAFFGCVVAAFLFMALCGCASDKGATGSGEEGEKPQVVVTPLEKAYSDIFVSEIETTPVLKKDYGEWITECQSVLINSLASKNKYKRVEAANGSEASNGVPALLVKIKIVDMRIASFGARFWGGALAGNSYMNMHMKLVDAGTKKILREDYFNSVNNAFAATWTFGASDRSLPSDMAKIMADYIEKAVPVPGT